MVSILEEQHRAHKERQQRIKQAAIKLAKPPTPPPAPPPEPETTPAATQHKPDILLEQTTNKPIGITTTVNIITDVVCSFYGVKEKDIKANRRLNNIVKVRHVLIYLIYNLTTFSSPQIGRKLNRDPTTIGYAIHKVEHNMEALKEEISKLEEIIELKMDQRKTLVAV
mgnify:FL=1